jgi:hypothetical protein
MSSVAISVPKQRQIDGVRHRFVASVRWVPMISAVVKRQQARRGIRVAEYLVEIDYTVIPATRADPVVDRLTVPTKNSDRFVITEVDRLRLIP